LIILPPAARFIKKIKDRTLRSRFQEIIHNIIIDPSCGEPKKGDLSGIYCCDFYYNKTNYEVAYTLEEDNGETIVVIPYYEKDLFRIVNVIIWRDQEPAELLLASGLAIFFMINSLLATNKEFLPPPDKKKHYHTN